MPWGPAHPQVALDDKYSYDVDAVLQKETFGVNSKTKEEKSSQGIFLRCLPLVRELVFCIGICTIIVALLGLYGWMRWGSLSSAFSYISRGDIVALENSNVAVSDISRNGNVIEIGVRNLTGRELLVVKISTTCDCTEPVLDRYYLPPLAVTHLSLRYVGSSQVESKQALLLVFSDGSTSELPFSISIS